MKPLNGDFQNCKHVQNRFKHYREITTRPWPKMNSSMRYFPTGSSWWRHFRWKWKDCRGICCIFRDIKKITSWRRRRRTSMIALSENAFAFRFEISSLFALPLVTVQTLGINAKHKTCCGNSRCLKDHFGAAIWSDLLNVLKICFKAATSRLSSSFRKSSGPALTWKEPHRPTEVGIWSYVISIQKECYACLPALIVILKLHILPINDQLTRIINLSPIIISYATRPTAW